MRKNKFLSEVYLVLLVSAWMFWPINGPAGAQAAVPAQHDSQKIIERMSKRLTQAQRQAAAKRQADAKAKVLKQNKKAAKNALQSNQVNTLAVQGQVNQMMAMAMAMPMPAAQVPHYFGPYPNWAYSPPLRKFVDSLPGLGAANANNLGQYIPVAVSDVNSYPGSDYYEIGLVQYTEQMHSDLPPTTLRGYVQLNDPVNPVTRDATGKIIAWPKPHYLGPIIISQKDRPVRVKFINLLPTGIDGDLFIPVDTTTMGAGMGPTQMVDTNGMPMFNTDGTPMMEMYTENRGTLHLHGGRTVWISDGTPHQWTTPAGEATAYPKGVSVQNVPDMPDPGPGSMTFFYSNQQSARLMFYHDHAYGITRLNVYAGEAAGYMITDPTEQDLIARGIIPAEQIPLIIQDKTFVNAATIGNTDPTWSWGSMPGMAMTGDLWFPHVYMPNQNPYDLSGANPYGRWDYGPWFWPPWPATKGEVANPYYDPINAPWEPQTIPGVPNVSMTMEAFHDTPLVNGTAYPYLNVQPKAYRFRILNAANDRFWNLMLVQADPAVSVGTAGLTEAKMVPFYPGTWPAGWGTPDARDGGVPDPTMLGPSIIQIGTEGGFLPAPVVWPNIPVDYEYDRRNIVVLNVKEHNLFLGCAERADVIIDFSAFAGKTLILYNDSPAPVPAADPRLDYYTGNPDSTETGGAPSTLPGFGPNTRTIMQIRVANTTPAPAYDVNSLNAEFASTATTQGVFAKSQDPIIVPQAGYNSAYNATFQAGTTAYERIQSVSLTFNPLDLTQPNKLSLTPLTITNKPKAIAEEFENEYGRMSGFLGVEVPFTNGMNQTTIFYGYIDPATEDINDSITPMSPVAGDGTQIWKITHNGVDTHPVHFHLFDVQLINRVGWDGAVRPPEKNELGWKETVRMNPLEDCIVALRPVAPKQPFGVPDSNRPLNPTMPLHDPMGFKNVDPLGNPITVTNEMTNFGWEYVWHCHILSHEEMDMMRPTVFNVARALAQAPVLSGVTAVTKANLTWTDGTPVNNASTLGNPANEIGFRIERATVTGVTVGAYSIIGAALANQIAYSDSTITQGTTYSYRVVAFNAAGNSTSNAVTVSFGAATPIAPTNLAAALQTISSARLTWTDNANNEIGFTIQRATNVNFTGTSLTTFTVGANVTTYLNTGMTTATTYYYRVRASNAAGPSGWSNIVSVRTAAPSDPTTLTATPSAPTANPLTITLSWRDNSTVETGFTIQRSISTNFTNPTTFTVLANTAGGTTNYIDNTVVLNTTYYYRVRAFNGAVTSAWTNTASARVGTLAVVIIDNGQAGTSSTGTWAVSGAAGFYGTNSVWSYSGATYTWSFTPTTTATYRVSMWWTALTSRSTSVPTRILSPTTTIATMNINQTQNGGIWNVLGQYTFTAGTTYRVTITAPTGSPPSTSADAVRFEQL